MYVDDDPLRRSRKKTVSSAQTLSPALAEKIENKVDVGSHSVEGALGVVISNGLKNRSVLGNDFFDVGRIFIEVGQIFLDAHKEIIVEGPHEIDLERVFGGVGDCHVKGDVGLGPQPPGLDLFAHFVEAFFQKLQVALLGGLAGFSAPLTF